MAPCVAGYMMYPIVWSSAVDLTNRPSLKVSTSVLIFDILPRTVTDRRAMRQCPMIESRTFLVLDWSAGHITAACRVD